MVSIFYFFYGSCISIYFCEVCWLRFYFLSSNLTNNRLIVFLYFVGLFKGSVTPDSDMIPHYTKLERPTSLNHLKNVYAPNSYVANGFSDSSKNDYVATAPASSSRSSTGTQNSVVTTTTNGTDKAAVSSMSILSPFDEQEEWAKISEIMASFGNGIDHKSIVTELEQEFESRLGNSIFKIILYA